MRVAVNLSAVQVAQPNLPQVVADALKRSGLPANRLELEVTETALIEDPEHAARVLGALHALGVEVSLDDFGTGYSSLSSIKRYPLSTIKLDRSFISGLAPGSQDAAIVGSVISMAHALSLSIVAEGVETTEQRDHLRRIGCDTAQGFLFCRPVRPEEFELAVNAAASRV
jgi:EAL domain-containing protein (putative c-di-GMP-specific phosphodiesterase class I)